MPLSTVVGLVKFISITTSAAKGGDKPGSCVERSRAPSPDREETMGFGSLFLEA